MSGPASGVRSEQRFTGSNPCPVCGGHDRAPRGQGERCFGFASDDGTWAHCSREELAGPLERNAGSDCFVHKLTGDCNCGGSHGGGGTVVDLDTSRKRPPRRKIVKTYNYRDESGEVLFQAVRYIPKGFSQRRPDGNGGWESNLKGVRRVPYMLPELLDSDPGEPVFVFEGERDVERACALELVATTNPQGAGKWRPEYSEALEGRSVVIVPDNDPPGHRHAEEVARSVYETAASVKVVHLPGLGEGEDFTNWLDGGGTEWELLRFAQDAEPWHPPSSNGHEHPARPNSTDLGNAERFVSQHGENVRYCYPWAKWLVWTGSRWALDDCGMVHRLAKETVKSLYIEAGAAETEEERKRLAKHARTSESANAIKAMLELARSDVPVSPEDLDAHPYLLNAPNGTIDLRTGELREHRREDLLTKITGTDYRPDTPAPTWEAFLERVLPSEDLRAFVQRSAGYSATGDTSEQCLFINHGGGANGKSTFQEAVSEALGDYATRTPTDMLMARRFNGVPNDVARLKGARFVAAAETEEGRRLDEARIKDLTGQDTISARFMRGEWFDFTPTHKLHVSTNHKPEIRGTDNAIWRRIRLIPWSVTVPPAEQDKKLPDKLRLELPGILSWVVAGCLAWHGGGLQAPEEVRKATGAYRAEMDVLAGFMYERCVLRATAWVKFADLYDSYTDWCDNSGERSESKRKFGDRLKERGFPPEKGTDNISIRRGIGLQAEPNPPGGGERSYGNFEANSELENYCSEGHGAPKPAEDGEDEESYGNSRRQNYSRVIDENTCKPADSGDTITDNYPESALTAKKKPHEELYENKGNDEYLSNSEEGEEPDIEDLAAMLEEGDE
jgi:putative DNA primase/helicase